MRRAYTYYAVRIAILAVALAGVWVAFAFIGDSWIQMAVAAAFGIVLTQIIFYSHDAAHRQIFQSHKANEITALIMGTLIGGVSLAWWNNKHNKHHAAPNQIGKDSDICCVGGAFLPTQRASAFGIPAVHASASRLVVLPVAQRRDAEPARAGCPGTRHAPGHEASLDGGHHDGGAPRRICCSALRVSVVRVALRRSSAFSSP